MKKEQISRSQLFALVLLFEIGSTTLFALGIDAKQDAWIVVIIGLVIGIGLLWIFTEIQSHFLDKNLAEILMTVLGRWIATPLILLYALSFFWTSAFNVYEFSESIVQNYLYKTPLSMIVFCVLALLVYSLFLGIEVIGRSAEIFVPWFLFFILSTFFLVWVSGEMEFQRLFPVLEGGFIPVIKTVPQIVDFPFGEMNVFLMHWCYVKNKENIRRTSMLAVIIAGIVLALSLVSMITAIGVHLTSTLSFPLFEVINKINIGEVIQRLDAIGGVVLFMGGFYKGLLYFNASRLAVQAALHIQEKYGKWLIITMTTILFIYINIYFTEFNFYRWAGLEVNTKMVYPLFQIFIPVLILLIIKIRTKSAENEKGKEEKV